MATRHPEQGKIAALRSSRGEDDLVRLGIQEQGYPIAGIIHGGASAATWSMNTGGIPREML
jgi:hypothetical protein